MNTFSLRPLLGLLALLTCWACSDPISDVSFDDWSPEVAAPLLNTKFTLRDALAGTDFAGQVTEDQSSALRLKVAQSIFEVRVGDRLEVPAFAVPLLDTVTRFDFAAEGIDLPVSRIDLTGGRMYLSLRNDYPQAAMVTIKSANFLVDGQPLRQVFQVASSSTLTDSIDVGNVSFRASSDKSITISYDADLAGGPQNVRLSGGFFALKAQDFTYAEGKLNDLALDLGLDSVAFDFFDAFEPGSMELVNPTAILRVENSVGAPIQLKTNNAYARKRDGSSMALTSELSTGVDFKYPSLSEGMVAKSSELIFDRETSNIASVIGEFPTAIGIGLQGQVNPSNLDQTFFLHRDAVIRGALEVDVPLAVRFNGFKIEKQLDFDASSLEEAQAITFLMHVDNGFGLDAKAQVVFYDGSGQELGNLFVTPVQVLAAARTNALGATLESTTTTVEIPIEADRVPVLAQARSAKILLELDSPRNSGAAFTQLYYNNELGVKLGARVTLKAL